MSASVTEELLLATTTTPWDAIRFNSVGYVAGVVVIPFPQLAIGCLKPFAPRVVGWTTVYPPSGPVLSIVIAV
jgi:hypothetical protein